MLIFNWFENNYVTNSIQFNSIQFNSIQFIPISMKRSATITIKYKSVKSIFAHGGDSEKTKYFRLFFIIVIFVFILFWIYRTTLQKLLKIILKPKLADNFFFRPFPSIRGSHSVLSFSKPSCLQRSSPSL